MAARTDQAPAADVPPAAAIRALRDAVAGIGRNLGTGKHDNAATILHLLGASLDDAQALHEYLSAHPQDT